MSGLTSFRGDAEGMTEGDAGGGSESRIGGTGSGKAPGFATSFSLTMISGRASSSSAVIGGGAGASAAEGDVRVAARADEVGLGSRAGGGIAVAIALECNVGTGGDFVASRGDDADTLVLLDEIDNDRDLGRAAARAPAARLFGGCAAEGSLVMGERSARGVLREFLRTLGERSRPITGRAGVAPPPSVAVVISGRVEEGVFARFLGKGRSGFFFS